MLLSLIRMIQAFRDYQRNVSELSQLSDRELPTSALIARTFRALPPAPITADALQPILERITPASVAGVVVSAATRYLCAYDRHQIPH